MNAAYPKVNFWDNLIPLRGGLEGPQLAGWTPRPPAKGGLGGVLYADQMIPVDAGVLLAADVYTPKAKGRYPAILVFSAHNKELHRAEHPRARTG
jgi:predicted acyl esterase